VYFLLYSYISFSIRGAAVLNDRLANDVRRNGTHSSGTDNAPIGHFQLLDHGCGTVSVQPTTVRPYPSTVPPCVNDVFVWLTETPAPSDFCF